MGVSLGQAQRVAAYVPATLTQRILASGLPKPGRSRSLSAATMFSDISGFTAMSEELASDGPRGAEELNRVLLSTFTGMIDVIHQMGGAISHFYGDAMSVYFPDDDGQAAHRALTCGQMMQKLMLGSLGKVSTRRPPGARTDFDLTIKIGLSYGRCDELIVGDPATALEFVLAGPAVDEAAVAANQARAHQVIASPALMDRVEEKGPPDQQKAHPALPPILDWSTADETVLPDLVELILPFIPPALAKRLSGDGLDVLAEHRPATSMFVQFSLSSGEPSGAETGAAGQARLLQRYYQWASQIVDRFGQNNARVNRVLTGDKGNQLHIIFGAPVAPDAPDQAVRCALALQRERPPYVNEQRVGLAAGKVFAGPVGASSRREYTVVGDVVNLSSRLVQLCQDGEVVVDSSAAARVRQQINLISLPPVQVKGKQQAVTPYRAQSERTRATQLEAYFSTWNKTLVGRQDELDLLLGGMDAALHGIGGVTTLVGSTGTGKTHLLSAGAKYWLEQGGVGLVGECYPHTADTPFAPWRGVWRSFFGLTADMELSTQAEVVTRQTLDLVPDIGPDVGLWSQFLGVSLPQSGALAELTAEARQARLFNLVRRCFQAAAARQPLLIILEGLHWADQASLALIDDLTAHVADHAIFVALAYRPADELSLETLNRPQSIPIVVTDLPPDDARILLRQLVGVPELSPTVEQYLGLRDREGRDNPVNPLFLEESLNVMLGMGVLERMVQAGSQARVRVDEERLSKMPVPDTIHGLLLARLDRLPAAGRDLLQVASVIGREFGLETLDSITPTLPRRSIGRLLEDLTVAEMTRLVAAAPELVYLFQHAMTREVAYESLPFARRQDLHAAVAVWLETTYLHNLKPLHSMLAHHYSQADLHEKGLHYALLAADDARDIFANREAVRLYNLAHRHLMALGQESGSETAVRLYVARCSVHIWLGDMAEAQKDAENALAIAQALSLPAELAESRNLLAETRWRQGEYEESKALTQSVIDELQEVIPRDQLALAYLWHGLASNLLLAFEPALDSLRKAERLCQEDNNNLRLARVLEAISYVYFMKKELEPALKTMQRSLQLSREFATPFNTGLALSNISVVQLNLGRPVAALETLEEAVAMGRDVSDYLLAVSLENRAAVLCYLGRFGDALLDFQQAADLLDAMDHPQQRAELYLFWALRYSIVLGDWEDTRYRLEQARQIIDQQPESFPEERVHLLLGMAHLALEETSPQESESQLREAAALVEEKDLVWWQPAVSLLLGLTRLQQEDSEDARAQFRQGIAAVEEGGSPDTLPLLLLELAQIEPDEDEKLALLERCVSAARQRASYSDRLRCLKEAGRKLVIAEAAHWQELGQACLAQSREMETRLDAALAPGR